MVMDKYSSMARDECCSMVRDKCSSMARDECTVAQGFWDMSISNS